MLQQKLSKLVLKEMTKPGQCTPEAEAGGSLELEANPVLVVRPSLRKPEWMDGREGRRGQRKRKVSEDKSASKFTSSYIYFGILELLLTGQRVYL